MNARFTAECRPAQLPTRRHMPTTDLRRLQLLSFGDLDAQRHFFDRSRQAALGCHSPYAIRHRCHGDVSVSGRHGCKQHAEIKTGTGQTWQGQSMLASVA